MRVNKLVIIALISIIAICILDVYLVDSYSKHVAEKIGWWKIIGAAALQIGVVLAILIGVAMRLNSTGTIEKDNDGNNDDYRNYVPVVFITLVFVGLALSVSLLHRAIVCPDEGLNTTRGQSECSSNNGATN